MCLRNGYFEAGIAEKVAHVHEIHEQYGRREARRKVGLGCGVRGGEVSGDRKRPF
jgi:hypothetical protein